MTGSENGFYGRSPPSLLKFDFRTGFCMPIYIYSVYRHPLHLPFSLFIPPPSPKTKEQESNRTELPKFVGYIPYLQNTYITIQHSTIYLTAHTHFPISLPFSHFSLVSPISNFQTLFFQFCNFAIFQFCNFPISHQKNLLRIRHATKELK